MGSFAVMINLQWSKTEQEVLRFASQHEADGFRRAFYEPPVTVSRSRVVVSGAPPNFMWPPRSHVVASAFWTWDAAKKPVQNPRGAGSQ